MKRMVALGGCLAAACLSMAVQAAVPQRVVSLGGSVTEIVYELGQGARLVADDLSSLYPDAATRLPRVGYYRAVSLEGILSVRPDLVLASDNAGPREVLDRVQDMGVPVEQVPDGPSLSSLYERVQAIAGVLAVPGRGDALAARIRADVQAAQSLPGRSLRALLLMNRTGQFMAAGAGTAAHALLSLAGLHNVLSEQVGYQSLSAEGVAALAPELIILTKESLGGEDVNAFLARPGIAATPAAQAARLLVLDDLLALGLGPRTGQAIRMLKQAAR